MVASRLFRPASRLLSRHPLSPAFRSSSISVPALPRIRTYATPAGKEYTVRDALNEALSEELESNDKVFILGEEVAQYNGASVLDGLSSLFGSFELTIWCTTDTKSQKAC